MHPVMPGAGVGGSVAGLDRVGLGVLTRFVSAGLVDEALAAAGYWGGEVQRRVRKVPARVAVYFVLALTLLSSLSYRRVWRELTGALPGLGGVPSRSGLSQARRRVGAAVLREVFDRVRGARGTLGMPGVFVGGWRVVSWDATHVDVPDRAGNAGRFRRSRGGRGNRAGYPHVLLLTLIECGTHLLIDAAFGERSEQQLARRLLGSVDAGMLLLGDRNFLGYELWNKACATGAALVWRVRSNCTPVPLPDGELPDGSWLAVLPDPVAAEKRRGQRKQKRFQGFDFGPPEGTTVRMVSYLVTVRVTDDDGGAVEQRQEQITLVTNLLDPAQADAGQLAALYPQRWESETGYKSLKVHQRGARVVLRSQDPDGVEQELWAYLTTYQLVRLLMLDAATHAGRDSDELSFTAAICVTRRYLGLATRRAQNAAYHHAVGEVLAEANGPRRQRTAERSVKRPRSSFKAAKRRPGQKVSKPVSYHLKITHTPQPNDP
jgi:hypothetical protein